MPGGCSYCGHPDHMARNCPKRRAALKAKREEKREQAPLRYPELDPIRVRLAEELWDRMHGRKSEWQGNVAPSAGNRDTPPGNAP